MVARHAGANFTTGGQPEERAGVSPCSRGHAGTGSICRARRARRRRGRARAGRLRGLRRRARALRARARPRRVRARARATWTWPTPTRPWCASASPRAPDDAVTWTPSWAFDRLIDVADSGGALIAVTGDPSPRLFDALDPDRVARSSARDLLAARMRVILSGDITWTIVPFPDGRLGGRGARRARRRPALGRARARRPPRRARPRRGVGVAPGGARAALRRPRRAAPRRPALHGARHRSDRRPGAVLGLALRRQPCARAPLRPEHADRGGAHHAGPPAHGGHRARDEAAQPPGRRPCATSSCASRRAASSTCARAPAPRSCATQIATDEGGAFLGEVALVAGSRVGDTGLTFCNTLLDENAACHIAFGNSAGAVSEDAAALDPDRQLQAGREPVRRAHRHPDRRPRRRGGRRHAHRRGRAPDPRRRVAPRRAERERELVEQLSALRV